MLIIKKDMDDMRAEWEKDKEALIRYQRESTKSTELINQLNSETQRLLNVISDMRAGRPRAQSGEQGVEDLSASVIEGAKGFCTPSLLKSIN